ncbi:glycosyltransferase [Psychrobacter sp. SHUES1]|uniref:glycosyltransferase n=1 Tax=Psychrobacter sp. SHUES1 TaxID=1849383 RepID=UPI0007F4D1F9|nr:glycosyltransferase [Psychrobacter sp. SHUES1]OAP71945.1 hypothetical protein A7325_09865 [Psychrobacter sp. SHUES1]
MTNLETPLISVVMSVYNGEKHLAEAIDSVLSQSYSNFEFIIVNDGSTDSSIEIIYEYINKDDRIIVIDRENKGLPYSLNEGIAKARGEYIARMDADDICLPDRFEKQINYLNTNNLDLCGTFIEAFGENINNSILTYPIYHNDIRFRLLFRSAFAHPTVMLKKGVFNNIQYKSEYKVAQDYQLWIDIINSGFRVGNLPEVLMKYRLHEEQASNTKLILQQETAKEIRKNYHKNLSSEDASLVHTYIALEKRKKVSLRELDSLLIKFQRLAEKFKVSEELIAYYLSNLYNLSAPKSPFRYLIYRKRTSKYKKDLKAETRMFVRSLILVDSNSKTFQALIVVAKKLNL